MYAKTIDDKISAIQHKGTMDVFSLNPSGNHAILEQLIFDTRPMRFDLNEDDIWEYELDGGSRLRNDAD